MNKIDELKVWFNDVTRGNDKYLENPSGQGDGEEVTYKFCLYTNDHKYSIIATERKEPKKSYLGCMVTSRKSRAGEDWHRGNDLADGDLTRETWEKIKNDIIRYELKPIEKQQVSAVEPPCCQLAPGSVVGDVIK